jgi:hypothetical protein
MATGTSSNVKPPPPDIPGDRTMFASNDRLQSYFRTILAGVAMFSCRPSPADL